MLLEHLLETWNTDAAEVERCVRRIVGSDCDLLIGGSLADDLGNEQSDIDLYCFTKQPPKDARRRLHLPCGEARVELNVIDIEDPIHRAGSLRNLIVFEGSPPAPVDWPLLSASSLRIMYALYTNRFVGSTHGIADDLRRHLGADILHVYVVLRQLLTCDALLDDVGMLTEPDDSLPAVHCARMLVESTLDGVLATEGLVHPNEKWRLALLARATYTRPWLPPMEDVLVGLFPPVERPAESAAKCVDLAVRLLEIIKHAGLYRAYPVLDAVIGRAAQVCAVRHRAAEAELCVAYS